MTALPTTFGKYRLLRLIATGGMGEVFLAKLVGPSGFEKLVVIKRLLTDRVGDPKYTEMFFAEARVQAQLSHGNIVAVHEVGEQDGLPYIAMEYVRGRSLKRVLERAKDVYRATTQSDKLLRPVLPAAYLVYIFAAVARGLKSAHEARHLSGAIIDIVHRDINPHNVLVTYQGEVKIIDFGIAKSEMTTDKTKVGTIKGTVVYMSPEQASGFPLDGRSDQFSLGICLYEALLGYNPFHRKTIAQSLEAIRTVDFPREEVMLESISVFAPIVSRCLAQKREARFNDCGELEEALVRLIATNAVTEAKEHFDTFLSELLAQDIADDERLLGQTDKVSVDALVAHTQASVISETQSTLMSEPQAVLAPASQPPAREEPTNPRGSAPPLPISIVATVPNDLPQPSEAERQPAAQDSQDERSFEGHDIAPPLDVQAKPEAQPSSDPPLPLHVSRSDAAPPDFSIEMVLGDDIMPTEPVIFEREATHLSDASWRGARRIFMAVVSFLAVAGVYVFKRSRPPPIPPSITAAPPSPTRDGRLISGDVDAKGAKGGLAPIFFSWGPVDHDSPTPLLDLTQISENDGALRFGNVKKGHSRGLKPLAMRLSVDPPQDVRYRGIAVRSSFRLHGSRGVFEIGHPGGADPSGFYVHIRFRRSGRRIFYEVTTEPRADVFLAGGMALGRTPLAEFEGLGTTSFTLRNSKISESWTITLGANNISLAP